MSSWTTEAALIGGQRIDREGVLELMRPPESAILIAIANSRAEPRGRPAGCIHVARHFSGDGYFGLLAVDPSLQRARLGSALVQAAERWARTEFSAKAMRLTVISVRARASPRGLPEGFFELTLAARHEFLLN